MIAHAQPENKQRAIIDVSINQLVRLVNVRGVVFRKVVNRLVVRSETITKTDSRTYICLFVFY